MGFVSLNSTYTLSVRLCNAKPNNGFLQPYRFFAARPFFRPFIWHRDCLLESADECIFSFYTFSQPDLKFISQTLKSVLYYGINFHVHFYNFFLKPIKSVS